MSQKVIDMSQKVTAIGVTAKWETSVLYLVPAACLHEEEIAVLYICFEKNTIPYHEMA